MKNTGSGLTAPHGLPGLFTGFLNAQMTDNQGDKPKAFLTVVFFDERFNFVSEGSIKQRVVQHGNNAPLLVLSNIKVPRNGYCYIYVSNESPVNVYFDNLRVRHDRGRILEENHYYAYGLKIAALSSRAFGGAPNAYQYQGDYSEFDDDLGWNDFQLRSYDPQLGRFLQWDPYDQFSSGYVGMGADPVNMVDEDGGWSAGATGALIGGVVGGVAGGLIANNNGGGFWGTLAGAVGGAVVGSSLGFAIGESLFGGECFNLWTNIKAFYSGLLGKSGNVTSGRLFKGHSALIPDVWGAVGNFFGGLSLPSLGSLRIGLSLWEDFSKDIKPFDQLVKTIQAINPYTLMPNNDFDEDRNMIEKDFQLEEAESNSKYIIVVESAVVAGSSVFGGINNKPGSDIVSVNGTIVNNSLDLGRNGQTINIKIKATPQVQGIPAVPSSRVNIIKRRERIKTGQRLKIFKFIKRKVKVKYKD